MRRLCWRGYARHGFCGNAWPTPTWAARFEGWKFVFACDLCRTDYPDLAWKPYYGRYWNVRIGVPQP